MLSTERFKNGDFRWADARIAFLSRFYGSLRACADAGNDLILDTEGWLETLIDLLVEHDVFFAAVDSPLETFIEREAA